MPTGSRAIAILTQPEDGFEDQAYVLGHLSAYWRSAGHRVEVVTDWTRPLVCDAAILHVDLTQVPAALLDLVQDHPCVLNRRAIDIGKRGFSRLRVRPGDGYQGPVILKTNLNYGGLPEARKLGLETWPTDGWGQLRFMPPEEYPIFPEPAQVPPEAWDNPALIIERFMPERTPEGHFSLRSWLFLGEAGVVWRSLSIHPIAKAGNAYRHDLLHEVPVEVREAREAMGLDFGKIDFGVVDGRAVVYDVNKTPTQSKVTERSRPVLEALARALHGFLDGSVQP
ncbi:MAG: hypothetical protein IPQ13_12170 [Holophagaceae bacterium]|nr:hypothetical protein [Holophagaceae bacterium]